MEPEPTRSPATSLGCTGSGCRTRRDGDKTRNRAAPGSRLCPGCQDRLADGVRRLPFLYAECGRLLGGATGGPRERTSGGPMPGLPFNTSAADARTAILSFLAARARQIAAERRVASPARTVSALAGFLGRHVGWLAAHHSAGEVSAEVALLVQTAQRVADPAPVRQVPVGACVEAGCGGSLAALVGRESGRAAEIRCDTDPGHRWTGDQWTELGRRMEKAAEGGAPAAVRWLSPADISHLWGIPRGSVYRLASEQQWHRRGAAGRVQYADADVRRTLARRTAKGAGDRR